MKIKKLTTQPLWASPVLGAKRRGIAHIRHMHGFELWFSTIRDLASVLICILFLHSFFIMYTSLNCANVQIFKCILNFLFCFVLSFWFYFLFFFELVISKEPQTSVPAEWRDVILHGGAWKGRGWGRKDRGCLSHPGYDMTHVIEPWVQNYSPGLERLV